MTSLHRRAFRQAGALQMEVLLALLVMGVLTAAALSVWQGAEQGSRQLSDNATLEELKGGLLAFALRRGRLPCPDADGDGFEGGAGGACPAGLQVGSLPFLSLGLQRPVLSEGALLRYGVFRGTGGRDLVAPGRPAIITDDPAIDGRRLLLNAALGAAAANPSTDQPFIARRSATDAVNDCTAASSTPAFVVGVELQPAQGSPRCFGARQGVGEALMFMGHFELVGRLAAVPED
ncbi:MAG: hypothetical protein WA159_21050 [Variovorax sp.]